MISLPYPVSANVYWRNVRGRMIVSNEAKAYKTQVGWLAKSAGMKISENNVELRVLFHPKKTKNGGASDLRLDLDNVIKVTADALNGIAYLDDKQIVKISAEIAYPVTDGGLSVKVTEV